MDGRAGENFGHQLETPGAFAVEVEHLLKSDCLAGGEARKRVGRIVGREDSIAYLVDAVHGYNLCAGRPARKGTAVDF